MCDEYDRTQDLTDEACKVLVPDPVSIRRAKAIWRKRRSERAGVRDSFSELAAYLERRFVRLLPDEMSSFTTSAVNLVDFYVPAGQLLREHCEGFAKRADRAPRPPKKGTMSRVLWDTSRKYMEDNIASAARKREMLFALRERHPIKFDWDVKLPDIPEKLTLPHATKSP